MWYEIIPSLAVIFAGVVAPPIMNYYLFKLVQKGNPFRRDVQSNAFDLGLFVRDTYLTGNPYVMKGLDNIPDDEEYIPDDEE